MEKKYKKITASQFQEERKDDAEFQEMLKKKEKERLLKEKILDEDAKNITLELHKAGFPVDSVWDFVNTSHDYEEAIPILIKHLSYNYMERNKEGIVRALAVKKAKGKANAVLIEEYSKTPPERHYYRWAIGNTLNYIVTKDDIDKIIPIVLDKRNGDSRDMFIKALSKFKTEKVVETLKKLLDDNEVAPYATKALQRIKK